MIYVYLFLTFFEIGLFGFGGGYGMLSLIQGEVVHHWGWMTTAEFTDIVLCHLLRLHRRLQCYRKSYDGALWQRDSYLCPRTTLLDTHDSHQ